MGRRSGVSEDGESDGAEVCAGGSDLRRGRRDGVLASTSARAA
jgi:hypothetical protein